MEERLAPREHVPFNTPPAAKPAVGFRANCSVAAKMGLAGSLGLDWTRTRHLCINPLAVETICETVPKLIWMLETSGFARQ